MLRPPMHDLPDLDQRHGDGPHAVSVGGRELVVLRTSAGLRAFEGRCPHQGALLGEGELDGDTLVCRNHRWRFDALSGQRRDGTECLIACPITVHDGRTVVDTSPLAGFAQQRARRTIDELPGPPGLPLLGNLHQLTLAESHLTLEDWASKYGPMFRFRNGAARIVAISDPQHCQQVLRARPELFTRHPRIDSVFSEMGVAGVFSAEGDAWRPQRKLAMQALSHRYLRGFYPALLEVAGRLRERWRRAAESGGALDIVEDLKRFTVDVTTRVAFGHDVNTIEQGDDVIQRRLELVFPAFNRRLFAPFATWRWFKSQQDRKLDRALAELREWLSGLVSGGRQRLALNPERAQRPENFLEAMLSARDDSGQPFSEQVIFGNLMTMLLAGEDTTAYTLAWAVHELCDSPNSVAGLRREADAAGEGLPDDASSAERLVFAGAVANETMRLRPIAPVLIAQAKAETVIGDLLVPAGTRVALLTRKAARDARHFSEPHVFKPERWLADHRGVHDTSAHIPFGSGPRLCPGRSLAQLEMKLVLSMLYREFAVERVGDAASVREALAFTMAPAGLKVRLQARTPGMRVEE